MHDLIIIGAGPAGITAAVYAARKRLSTLVISEDIGGQAAWSGDIENYTGYQFITGPELASKFEEHLKSFDIILKESETVTDVRRAGDKILVKTNKNVYEAKTVIIASGKVPRPLDVPGEKEFKNRGLTYCATCDAPLFKGKDVAVIGGGNSALDASLQLLKIARRIYLINIEEKLSGDPVMREKAERADILTVMNKSRVRKIIGDGKVKAIEVDTGGESKRLEVEGVFVEIGLVPNSGFAADVDKNELGEIKVDRHNRTNAPGIFAAGDVTDVPEKQIIIAAGEGSRAALAVFRYLSQQK